MCVRGAVEADQTRTSDMWHIALPYDSARSWIGAFGYLSLCGGVHACGTLDLKGLKEEEEKVLLL